MASTLFENAIADIRASITNIARSIAPHRANIIYTDPSKLSVDAYAAKHSERVALENRLRSLLNERDSIIASRRARVTKATTDLRMAEQAWGEIMRNNGVTGDMIRNFYNANRKRREAMENAQREEHCPVYVGKQQSAPKSRPISKTPPQGKTNYIKDAIIWTDFKFKTFDECASLKRSAKTYMSKDDILEVIKKRPSLKKRMPVGYSSATKEALCRALFDM